MLKAGVFPVELIRLSGSLDAVALLLQTLTVHDTCFQIIMVLLVDRTLVLVLWRYSTETLLLTDLEDLLGSLPGTIDTIAEGLKVTDLTTLTDMLTTQYSNSSNWKELLTATSELATSSGLLLSSKASLPSPKRKADSKNGAQNKRRRSRRYAPKKEQLDTGETGTAGANQRGTGETETAGAAASQGITKGSKKTTTKASSNKADGAGMAASGGSKGKGSKKTGASGTTGSQSSALDKPLGSGAIRSRASRFEAKLRFFRSQPDKKSQLPKARAYLNGMSPRTTKINSKKIKSFKATLARWDEMPDTNEDVESESTNLRVVGSKGSHPRLTAPSSPRCPPATRAAGLGSTADVEAECERKRELEHLRTLATERELERKRELDHEKQLVLARQRNVGEERGARTNARSSTKKDLEEKQKLRGEIEVLKRQKIQSESTEEKIAQVGSILSALKDIGLGSLLYLFIIHNMLVSFPSIAQLFCRPALPRPLPNNQVIFAIIFAFIFV